MKKTMVILMVVAAALFGCNKTRTTEATETVVNDPAGVYILVDVDGESIPGMITHGGHEMMLYSGRFTINGDKTCISETVFGSQKINRTVKATYSQDGSTLKMKWVGAGRTVGTVEGDRFKMNNEGMVFTYKKQPMVQ